MEGLYRTLGQRLRGAREAAHWTQDELSRRIREFTPDTRRFSPTMLSYFETGTRRLRLEDLSVLAQAFQVPVAYFLDGTELGAQGTTSPSVLLRAARYVHPEAQRTVERFADETHSLRPIPPSLEVHPAMTPIQLLHTLGLTEPPVDLDTIANRLGLHVVLYAFDDPISGVLVVDGPLRVIGVNHTHHLHRQRFTMAHEIGHFVKRHNVVVDVSQEFWGDPSELAAGDPLQERQANSFAAELLMPASWVTRDKDTLGADVGRLAPRYRVSGQAMWLRLVELGLVTL